MTHMRAKLIAAALILALALTYLAVAGVKKGWVYHMEVDAFLAESQLQHQRVRLCGKVASENLQSNPGRLSASFTLLGQTRSVPVVYHGVVPDLFKADGEVVIEGQLDDAGVFQSDLMLTKCASKYEAEGHGKHPAEKPQ